jgi:CDP-glucose 4,6-dehydratase
MSVRMPNREFWNGKRVLLTGHTGFKGGWLAIWLNNMGAQVIGVSLPPNTVPSLFSLASIQSQCENHICDIRDAVKLTEVIKRAQPEIVFHLAAQPLVRQSYTEPLETFSSNVIGTANLLDAMRGLASIKVAVMITTDKVYLNKEWIWPYRENDALGGHDPYSASKAASEIVISSYRDSFLSDQGIAVASARAGNVIGGGDWSADRLIPDAVRAWNREDVLEIRRPDAIRPWQYVLEPLAGYLLLAQKLHQNASMAGSYNFGPHTTEVASVREIIEIAKKMYGRGGVIYKDRVQGPHEAGRLTLDTTKSQQTLGFMPRLTLSESLRRTMDWYLAQSNGADVRLLCELDIANYESFVSKTKGSFYE